MQGAYVAPADAAGLIDVALHIAQRTARALQQGLAGSGQAYGAGGAEEEWISQQLFELAYLLGEGRLGKMEALRRASEMQFLGNRDKVTKVSQLDIAIHIQNILIQQNKILDVIDLQRETAVKAFSQCFELFNGGYEQLSLAESCANSCGFDLHRCEK
jgi:hypothetical protein